MSSPAKMISPSPFSLPPASPTNVPIHCQLRSTIKKMQDCRHTLNRAFTAMHTWANEGDLASINRECIIVKSSVSTTMGSLSNDLEGMLHSSSNQFHRFVCKLHSLFCSYFFKFTFLFTLILAYICVSAEALFCQYLCFMNQIHIYLHCSIRSSKFSLQTAGLGARKSHTPQPIFHPQD